VFVPVEKYFNKNRFVAMLMERSDIEIVYCDYAPSFFPFKRGSKTVTKVVGNCYYHIVAKKLDSRVTPNQ
ncbi:MAG: hypothetical protein SV375_13260, partial [Thermodesulfobacteriota bacterium]|nr:hypothetical protein [Thermodesulfobacteriota bacterium]